MMADWEWDAPILVHSLWDAEDVLAAAERIGLRMKQAEAEEFLRQNENRFLERLSEYGNETLEGMLENERYLRARARFEEFAKAQIAGKEMGGQNDNGNRS